MMQIKGRSAFKNPVKDLQWFENWAAQLENHNQRQYERLEVETALGKTRVWGLNTADEGLETLVVFPGARTTPLFWDFDRGLDRLGRKLKIYLVETNGLPNPSEGNTPDIKSRGYGEWASGLLDKLNVDRAFVAGASFGGLVCMKLCITNPEKVKAAILLNPGCLQPFSLRFKNLYYNLLPILAPNRKNVLRFLDRAVFCKPTHQLSEFSEELILSYELFALTRYKDNTQKPYYMGDELRQVKTDTYLLEGDKDLLFPFQTSIRNAREKIGPLKEVKVFENVGHGIETYGEAMGCVGEMIGRYLPSDVFRPTR
jgi:pimeloyl-ACP methyl ester carboxylesterase